MVAFYSVFLRLQTYLQDVLSLEDIRLTTKALIKCFVLMLLSSLMSDGVLLWLLVDAILLYPLAYQKKK